MLKKEVNKHKSKSKTVITCLSEKKKREKSTAIGRDERNHLAMIGSDIMQPRQIVTNIF